MKFMTFQLLKVAKQGESFLISVDLIYLHLLGLSSKMCSLRIVLLVPIFFRGNDFCYLLEFKHLGNVFKFNSLNKIESPLNLFLNKKKKTLKFSIDKNRKVI